MTITFTKEEWESFASSLERWRYAREFLMEKILTDALGAAKANDVCMKYNEAKAKDTACRLESPIPGMLFHVL